MKQQSIFERNFEKAIRSIPGLSKINIEGCEFYLKPVEEEKGIESSKDDWMINAVLKNNQIEKGKSFVEAIRILSAGNSHYPLWINLKQVGENMFELEFSTRFRHIKTSHNRETGVHPFKVVDENSCR